ncbi:MAG: response regulator transcription factor [Bacillota bacterium]|nr:response regulator transcription factor [Bacillota bacterium]
MKTILIVEDDADIRNLISDYCKASGHRPITAADGEEALRLFENEKPHLVLLDIIVPKVDGFELCRRLRRESATPIIMVSSKQDESDKILALGLGADDYVEKPFSPRLLVAKIDALLRRVGELSGEPTADVIEFRGLRIHEGSRTCSVGERNIDLSKIEFDILLYIVKHKNQVLSRDRIFDAVWGVHEIGDPSTVTVHVKKIREKIGDDPKKPQIIQTVWGVGYAARD